MIIKKNDCDIIILIAMEVFMTSGISGYSSPDAYQGKLDSDQLVQLGKRVEEQKKPLGGSPEIKQKISNLATTLKTNIKKIIQGKTYYKKIAKEFISKENKDLLRTYFSNDEGKLDDKGKIIQRNVSKDLRLGDHDVPDLKKYAQVMTDLPKIDTKSQNGWFKQSASMGLNLKGLDKPNFLDYKKNQTKFDNLVRLDKLAKGVDGATFARILGDVG